MARVLAAPDSRPFVIAPVIDYGKTTYDSYLSDGTKGHGSSKYFLGGLLVRKMNKNGFYWEGSFRGGKADTEHVYGVYSHTHVNGMNTKISTGERYSFDSVDNGTFMLGYRLTTRTSPISRLYTGLAFQYEFNGSTSATWI